MRPTQERTKAIQAAEKRLVELSNELQKKYFDKVWRSISGSISASGNSITRITQNPIFVQAWKEIVGRGISKFLKEEFTKIEEKATSYYSQYTPPTLDFKTVKEIVLTKLNNNIQQFAAAYNINTSVATETRNFAVSQISAGKSFAEVRDATESFIVGTGQRLGVVDNYNLVQNRVQDTFAQFDRTMSNQYATQLQLNYFIYQGGEILTTRSFCEERNAGVFTREQGVSWNALDWDGKMPGDVMQHAGGYNCRHYFDWISYELAVQLNPNIERSIFDVK